MYDWKLAGAELVDRAKSVLGSPKWSSSRPSRFMEADELDGREIGNKPKQGSSTVARECPVVPFVRVTAAADTVIDTAHIGGAVGSLAAPPPACLCPPADASPKQASVFKDESDPWGVLLLATLPVVLVWLATVGVNVALYVLENRNGGEREFNTDYDVRSPCNSTDVIFNTPCSYGQQLVRM